MGKNENGPDSLADKEAIVKYLKDSFAYAHKALHTITAANALGEVKSPFGSRMTPRVSLRQFSPGTASIITAKPLSTPV